ncbi:putative membrane transporter protein YjnA [Denitratisoma oestradiolicum]|uniref:Probable membrane transporter protein n=1 Tax=Denitratisoma oestradiolicum TaxID=311182 RepID=A0A6S6YJE0_9PROT|nr:putative membrane transporter protein YjnA [Denitratisoma oestradiolicum]
MIDLAQTLSGFVVGAIVGVTGVGGGSLMTPILVLFFGITPATAVGTDLLYAAITKSGGTWVHGRKGTVDWRIVRYLALGSMPAAALTLVLTHQFAPGGLGGASKVMTTALGVALVLTAAALIFRQRLLAWARRHDPDTEHHPWKTVAVGATLGVLVSISSVGAGALGVTALFFLYPKLPAIRIVGSDLAHAVPLTLVAGIGHWWLGSVNWSLLGSLLLGSLPGIYIGSHLASRIPERILRPTLAGMLVLVGGKLIAF